MASHLSDRQEDHYFRVMKLLQDKPDMTQRELAAKVGSSLGGLNYCLNALIDKGWVKMHNFSESQNNFGYVYLLTPVGLAEKTLITARFLTRKMREYEALKLEIAALKVEVAQINQPDNTSQQP
jgi:EPS-associated MarR family transcriptional regulator